MDLHESVSTSAFQKRQTFSGTPKEGNRPGGPGRTQVIETGDRAPTSVFISFGQQPQHLLTLKKKKKSLILNSIPFTYFMVQRKKVQGCSSDVSLPP